MTGPVCTVIAGPNGAGKTTFALKYLRGAGDCDNFVNADLIAAAHVIFPQRGDIRTIEDADRFELLKAWGKP